MQIEIVHTLYTYNVHKYFYFKYTPLKIRKRREMDNLLKVPFQRTYLSLDPV